MNRVIWLSEAGPNQQSSVGNKAARLAGLLADGFPIPLGFCVTSLAAAEHAGGFTHTLGSAGPDQTPAAQDSLREIELNPALVAEVADEYERLQALVPGPVAVRSSAAAEDLEQHSFAGLYDTVLDVADLAGVLAALRQCWTSYWSAEAVHYRAQANLPADAQGMSVLVQAMIDAKCAGVLFTCDPRGEQTNALVIESVAGQGEALVNGAARAQRHWVERDTQRPLAASQVSTHLDERQIRTLAEMGLAIERRQGGPQDIEWAVDQHDQLWILQTRPVTLDREDWAGPWRVPGKEWLATYDEPFSPLGCDLALRRYDVWVDGINALCRTKFNAERRVANGGFIYYRPTWRNRSRPLRLWMRFWQLTAFMNSRRILRRYTEEVIPRHEQWLTAASQAEIGRLSDQSLRVRFDEAIDSYLALQFSSYAIGRVAVTAANLLDWVCRLWLAEPEHVRALDLLSGLEDASVRRELALYRLGRLLAEINELPVRADLHMAHLEALRHQPGRGRRFWAELQHFLEEYGYSWADRYPRDPAWQLNATALVASLANAANSTGARGYDERHRQQKLRRKETIGRAMERLSGGPLPWRRVVFGWLLRRAEVLFPFKENRNHRVYRSVMVIRKYAQEIGRRLAARERLPAADDVFFLEWDEIKALWAGDRPLDEVRRTVTHRKRRFEAGRRYMARLGGAAATEPSAVGKAQADRLVFSGEVCSPGIAVGRARLVRSLGELQRVGPGDILVCSQLRPAWSQVFARAGGAVIEQGSLLSHGSTLAREYGIPAVINIAGVTNLVRDGDRLTVDGSLGQVVVERGDSDTLLACLPVADGQPHAHLVRD